MGVMGTEEEERDRDAQQEFFGRGVLVTVIYLLPEVEIVVGASIEFERNTTDVVKHEIGAEHIRDVGERPGSLLRHSRNDIEKDFERYDKDEMYSPCS